MSATAVKPQQRVQSGPNGEPVPVSTVVVECGGRLFDRVVHYWPHRYSLSVGEGAGPILTACLRPWFERFDTDAEPENRARRAEVQELADRASAGRSSPSVETRRAWRIVDFALRTSTPLLLDLAGFGEHAAAFRTIAPVTGPDIPLETSRVFRAAYRLTDRESNDAIAGRGRYFRPESADARAELGRVWQAWRRSDLYGSLYSAAREAVPSVQVHVDDRGRRRSPVGYGFRVAGYARLCVEHLRHAPPRARIAAAGEIQRARERLLVDELIAMGAQAAARRRAA